MNFPTSIKGKWKLHDTPSGYPRGKPGDFISPVSPSDATIHAERVEMFYYL